MAHLTTPCMVDTRIWNHLKLQDPAFMAQRSIQFQSQYVPQHIQWEQDHATERVSTNNNLYSLISIFVFFYKGDANPSPNSYTLPILIGDKIPNRTSSACYSMPGRRVVGGFDIDYAKTPGPARYGVTSAEVMQRKAPVYSMQSRNYMPASKTQCNNFTAKNIILF